MDSSLERNHNIFQSGGALAIWLAICLSGFFALSLSLTAHHIFNSDFKPGERIDQDLIAARSTLVIDASATERERQKVRNSIVPVFKKNSSRDQESVDNLQRRLAAIEQLQKAGIVPLAEQKMITPADHLQLLNVDDKTFDALFSQSSFVEKLGQSANIEHLRTSILKLPKNGKSQFTLSRTSLIAILQKERETLRRLQKQNSQLSDPQKLLAVTVQPSNFDSFAKIIEPSQSHLVKNISRVPLEGEQAAWVETAAEFLPDSLPLSLKQPAAFIMAASMQPNMEIDRTATEAKIDRLVVAIKPVMKQINVGQIIVPRNSVLSPEMIESLHNAGIRNINRWPLVLSLWLSLAAACALVGLFLYAYEPKHLFLSASIGLMFTVSILTCAMATTIGLTYPMFVPLPAVALILTIFFGQRVAIVVILPLTILLAVDHLVDFNNLIALSAAAGSAIGTYSKRRHALMTSGVVIAVSQLLGFLIAALATQGHYQNYHLIGPSLGKTLVLEFAGGITSAIIAIGSLPFLESIFGMITPFRLAELNDADQPLLRRLQENAPGTYQHSLAVANLAEAGARAIGADVNLVRAGAMYHDIGKMVQPRFFIENQLGDKNPHDSMTPEQSRERVLAHVTDGLALSKEFNLPRAVQDFIPMHQGTSLMAYFYHKACLRDGTENVDPMFYRYPGPKPQSKETSIVMLADVSEAVTHSLHDPTQEEVEAVMTKVFQNRWEDGQFSDAGLVYSELELIKKAFAHVWRTLHHERLKYPSTTTGKMAVPPDMMPSSSKTE